MRFIFKLVCKHGSDIVPTVEKFVLVFCGHRFIQEVGSDHLWVALSPCIRGRVYILDASSDPAVLRDLAQRFTPGQAVRCSVVQVWTLSPWQNRVQKISPVHERCLRVVISPAAIKQPQQVSQQQGTGSTAYCLALHRSVCFGSSLYSAVLLR